MGMIIVRVSLSLSAFFFSFLSHSVTLYHYRWVANASRLSVICDIYLYISLPFPVTRRFLSLSPERRFLLVSTLQLEKMGLEGANAFLGGELE